jgi:hypothetical protein
MTDTEFLDDEISISDQDLELLQDRKRTRSSPRKTPAPKRQRKGRPVTLHKYKFTTQDMELVEKSLTEDFPPSGVDYVKLQTDLFKLRDPPVTLKDVQNLVNNTPHLKNIVKEGHKRLKAEAKRKFDEFISVKKDAPIAEKKDEPREDYNDHVTFLASENHYGWVYRHNLAQIVEISLNVERNSFLFEVESRELLEEEQVKLNLSNFLPDGKPFEKVYAYSKNPKVVRFAVPIPADGVIEGYDRQDEDTSFGCLVELWMPRKPRLDLLKLKPKRHAHIASYATTTTPLLTRTSVVDPAPANESNDGRESGERSAEPFDPSRVV